MENLKITLLYAVQIRREPPFREACLKRIRVQTRAARILLLRGLLS